MDATITNLSTSPIFIPGPDIDMAATGDAAGNDVRVWAGIVVGDLDGNPIIKAGVVAGTLSVSIAPDANDAAVAIQGSLGSESLSRYAVADLPTGFDGRAAFATDGRAGAEGGGGGTGTMVVYSNAQWRRVEDLAQVAA